MSVGSAAAKTSWPSQATPMGSTLGWFQAINKHDRQRLLRYVAPSAQGLMGWAQPSRQWARFTHLRCRHATNHGGGRQVRITCTFHELGPVAVVGNRDSFWDVYLEHTRSGWLIVNYGQG